MSYGYVAVFMPLVAVAIAMATARRQGAPGLSRRLAVIALACFCGGAAAGFLLVQQ